MLLFLIHEKELKKLWVYDFEDANNRETKTDFKFSVSFFFTYIIIT